VRIRRGPATVTGKQTPSVVTAVIGWKAGASADPGARTLRLSRPSAGARTPEEAAWKTTVYAR
jgi:hypothetical protein